MARKAAIGMIVKNRGLQVNRAVTKRPKSSIPQRESSVHLDLQLLYSKKNMLMNNIRLWSTKLAAIEYELEKIDEEITELEIHTNKSLNDDLPTLRHYVSADANRTAGKSNVKIVELEY
jgi:hypothetical protein